MAKRKRYQQVYTHSWDEMDGIIKRFAMLLPYGSIVWGIPRNGSMIASWAAHHNPSLQVSLQQPMPFTATPQSGDGPTIIIDDILDSGDTLLPYVNAGFYTATLFWRDKAPLRPTWTLLTAPRGIWLQFPWEQNA